MRAEINDGYELAIQSMKSDFLPSAQIENDQIQSNFGGAITTIKEEELSDEEYPTRQTSINGISPAKKLSDQCLVS